MVRPSLRIRTTHAFFLLGSLLLAVSCLAAFPGASAGTGRAFALRPPEGVTITFRKIFKTSYPEFVEIKIHQNGKGTYDIRQLDEAASPSSFDVGPALVQRIFSLAAKLNNFQGVDLEIHRRIANLGEKTLRYEKGGEVHEVKFNYTLDDSATQLLNIFEGITRQESDLSTLVRVMRYDRLGVNDAVGQLETDFNNKLLPEPERLLPALDQVASDDSYIEIARQRARTLASKIRSR
jgi:hypothetical protein